jgi:hypothetical protein
LLLNLGAVNKSAEIKLNGSTFASQIDQPQTLLKTIPDASRI